jgi:deoxyribonuclease V
MTCASRSGPDILGKISGKFSLERAEEAQRRLGALVECEPLKGFPPRTIAGVDVHYRGSEGFAALALIEYETLRILQLVATRSPVLIDYLPGFLAFREAPLIFKALRSCERPDVLLINGHGVAHPRGCGLASHVGVVEGLPTIGVALKPLRGSGPVSWTEIEHGSVKLYVSVGNLITLRQAADVLRHLLVPNIKLPLPLYIAHQVAHMSLRWDR